MVVAEPDAQVDGLESTNELGGKDGARGPSAAQLASERDRLSGYNRSTCDNGGGRDRV